MRCCIIRNPASRSGHDSDPTFWNEIAELASVRLTTGPGDGVRLAREAVDAGFDTIVAAGGDGTINEVANGIAERPLAAPAIRLGILPSGTVNVLALEYQLPSSARAAWERIRLGRTLLLDLPLAEFRDPTGSVVRRRWTQLAGAGWDAQAVLEVPTRLKRLLGRWAYAWAALRTLPRAGFRIRTSEPDAPEESPWVLVGNGRLYAGRHNIFPAAAPGDGRLNALVFHSLSARNLAALAARLASRRPGVPTAVAHAFDTSSISLTASEPCPLELDGEAVGSLPARLWTDGLQVRLLV